MSKKLFLTVPLPSKPGRFKVESGLVGDRFRWLIVEKGTGAVVAYEKKFDAACDLRDDFEKRFPAPPETPKMTQEQLDTMPPDQQPTSLYRLLRWKAERARV